MQLSRNGITFQVDDAELTRLVLEKFNAQERVATIEVRPKIGELLPHLGGFYAGIARGITGEPDYHLIAGPEHTDEIEWAAAVKWASAIEDGGFKDWQLPRRKEQALLFANVPELFKPSFYWSAEQRAGFSDYAWGQYFDDGSQDDWHKDDDYRARAVRRFPIR